MASAPESWASVRQVPVLVEEELQARLLMSKLQSRGFSMSRSATPSSVSHSSRTADVITFRVDWGR
jgi:hypothetical protein